MELWQLRQMQSLPLDAKIIKSQQRIREWHGHWGGQVYVAFSGGKDSTVLLDIARQIYPRIPAVFADTGLEYPEIVKFVETANNVKIIRPEMSFRKVLQEYGYPVVSKEQAGFIYEYRNSKSEKLKQYRWHGNEDGNFKISEKWKFLVDAPFKISDKCCDVMKKKPFWKYDKETNNKPMIGVMASDGDQRRGQWLRHGCNAFKLDRPRSHPLSFWLEKDIWEYLHRYDVPYSKIYDMGYPRTGCMFCMFGVHLEGRPNRFERMKHSHPSLWRYCMFKLGLSDVLDYVGVPWGQQMDLYDMGVEEINHDQTQ